VLGVPIADLTGGYKCFRASVLEAIDCDAIRSEGYAFQIEFTYLICRAGLSVAELPIVFVDRSRGTSKLSKRIIVEALWRVWVLKAGRA
jgi:dolichol-phosphate mannosyltransferase